jgi:hypothetical protein
MAARKKAKKKVTRKRVTKRKVTVRKTVKKKPVRRAAPKKAAPKRRSAPAYIHDDDKPTAGLGVVVLLLNALVLPGLGSLIGRKINAGLVQLILAILGQLFLGSLVHSQLAMGFAGLGALGIIGLVLLAVSWIWGIVSGILIIRDSF